MLFRSQVQGELAVVRQQEEALAVVIEATDGVQALGHGDEGLPTGVRSLGIGAGQHAIGLMEHDVAQPLEDDAARKQQRVWTVREGQLAALPVTTGSASGGMTEVVSGEVQPGMAVVVDTVSSQE